MSNNTYVAEGPTWVICFSTDQSIHNYNALDDGNHIATGLDVMEVYTDEQESITRYRDFEPAFGMGPHDVNTAYANDFLELPNATYEVAEAIVANQPHWESVEALAQIDGVTPELLASWGDAVVWNYTTHQPEIAA